MEHAADYLIRCQHDRCLPEGGKLCSRLGQAPLLGQVSFDLLAGRECKVRHVVQRIRAERIKLNDGSGACLPVTCVLVKEIDPPVGVKPVVWRLLSNRMADTLEQAVELLDGYRVRWEIELFFLILKEGCRIEALQFEEMARIETVLALYLVEAWRLNRLMRLGCTLPELPADVLLQADEWKAAYLLNHKKVPKQVPPLREAIRRVAQLGGFLGRKGDGEPGAKTLWLGLVILQCLWTVCRRLSKEK